MYTNVLVCLCLVIDLVSTEEEREVSSCPRLIQRHHLSHSALETLPRALIAFVHENAACTGIKGSRYRQNFRQISQKVPLILPLTLCNTQEMGAHPDLWTALGISELVKVIRYN